MASRCQRCARASILWSSVDMSGLFLLFGALAKQKPAHDLKSWLVAPGTPCRQGGYVKRGVKKREAAPALLAVSVASILRYGCRSVLPRCERISLASFTITEVL